VWTKSRLDLFRKIVEEGVGKNLETKWGTNKRLKEFKLVELNRYEE